MISQTELSFLRGICSDEAYPYYFIWQEPERPSNSNYRTIHVYLSKDPIDVSGRAFSCGSDSKHFTLVDDRIFTLVESGSISSSVPDQYLGYTNTPDTPYFADIYDSTVFVSREVPFNIPLVVAVVFAASLIAGIVRSILFGGKS